MNQYWCPNCKAVVGSDPCGLCGGGTLVCKDVLGAPRDSPAGPAPAKTPKKRSGTRWDRVNTRPKRTDGYRSQAEAEYAERLQAMVKSGEVEWWRYQAMTLRLPSGSRYTPDFVVDLAMDAPLELHEVKGRAGLRLDRLGAEKFNAARKEWEGWGRFKFVLAVRTKDGWEVK